MENAQKKREQPKNRTGSAFSLEPLEREARDIAVRCVADRRRIGAGQEFNKVRKALRAVVFLLFFWRLGNAVSNTRLLAFLVSDLRISELSERRWGKGVAGNK